MQGKSNRIFLNVLMILAFIGAGISPACKFISGQTTWMEICGVAGMEKIRVAADQAPIDVPDHKEEKSDCAFCFFGTNIKPHAVALMSIPAPTDVIQSINYAQLRVNLSAANNPAALPRGPPASPVTPV